MANAYGYGPGSCREELRRRRGRGIGPQLLEILQHQERSEYYTDEHFRRLVRFEATSVQAAHRQELCKDVHGTICSFGCRSCHSCRQKTVGRKTDCQCGRATGVWCASCLSTRMGQNLEEVLQRRDWQCPSCMQICNCSGRTCDRHLAGLGCTHMLSSEARHQGYQSTAHYIIQTHLEIQHGIAPALDAGPFQVGTRQKRGSSLDPNAAATKRARIERPAPRVLRQLVEKEFEPPTAAAPAEISMIEEAGFQMTEMWLNLASAAPSAASSTWSTEKTARHNPNRSSASVLQTTLVMQPLNQEAASRALPPKVYGIGSRPYSAAPAPIPHMGTLRDPRPACRLAASFGLRKPEAGVRPAPAPSLPPNQPRISEAAQTASEHASSDTNWDGPHPGLLQEERRQLVQIAFSRPRSSRAGARALHNSGRTSPELAGRQASHRSAGFSGHQHAPEREDDSSSALPEAAQPLPRETVRGGSSPVRRDPAEEEDPGRRALTNTLFGTVLEFAQDFKAAGYPSGSDMHEAMADALGQHLWDVVNHFSEPVLVSSYNKEQQDELRGESERPSTDMRDHECLKDACSFLHLAAQCLPDKAAQDLAVRLLFNQMPFVDFGKSDPRARAVLLKTAFDVYEILMSQRASIETVKLATDGILQWMAHLVDEYEELEECPLAEGVAVGPIKAPPPRLADQERQLQEDVQAVREADDLLLQLALRHIQRACHSCRPGERLLEPRLLQLIGQRRVSEDARFQVCCLLIVFLASVAPEQASKIGRPALCDRQRLMAELLSQAKLKELLEGLVRRSRQDSWRWDTEQEAELHVCPKVDAIKDKLLARVTGLLIEAGRCRWQNLIDLAVSPATSFSNFCSQADAQHHRAACIFVAVGLQAMDLDPTLSALLQQLLTLWWRQAFDCELLGCGAFVFFTEVLAGTAALRDCLSGFYLEELKAGLQTDKAGWIKSKLLGQFVANLKEFPDGLAALAQDLSQFLETASNKGTEEHRRIWDASGARILTAICIELQNGGWVDYSARLLALLPKFVRRGSAACLRAQFQSDQPLEGSGTIRNQKAATADQIAAARVMARGTSLSVLSDSFQLLSLVYENQLAGRLASFPEGIHVLRAFLSPALEISSAAYLPAPHLSVPGSGKALDVVMAELVARGLAEASPSFVHYVLGTCVHIALERLEKAAVNALRLMSELFCQPAVRHSESQLRLLLPPLLPPLLESMCSTRPSCRVQEAGFGFYTSLLLNEGELAVPQLEVLPLPDINTAEDLMLFERGKAPSASRFAAAQQRMLQLLCCLAVNAVSITLKGTLAEGELENPSLTIVGSCPVFKALSNRDVARLKSNLSKLLGTARALEPTKAVYADLPCAACEKAPPDFYLRLAERSLAFLKALAETGPNGCLWAAAAALPLKQHLTPPAGTDDLRELYKRLLDVLSSSGGDVSGLELADTVVVPVEEAFGHLSEPAQIANRVPASATRAAAAGQQNLLETGKLYIRGMVLHKVTGTFNDFRHFSDKHDALLLRQARVCRDPDAAQCPLNAHVRVMVAKQDVEGSLRALLLDQKELRKANSSTECIVFYNLRFHSTHPNRPDISTVIFVKDGANTDRQSQLVVEKLEEAATQAVAAGAAMTQQNRGGLERMLGKLQEMGVGQDRAAAVAALRQAVREKLQGHQAVMQRAVDILLSRQSN